MRKKITSLKDEPLSNGVALARIRRQVEAGAIQWAPYIHERAWSLGYSDADVVSVAKSGEVTGNERKSYGFIYRLEGLAKDGTPVGFMVDVMPHLVIIRILTTRTLTEE